MSSVHPSLRLGSAPLVCSASFFLPTWFCFWFSTISSPDASSDFCSLVKSISGSSVSASSAERGGGLGEPFHVVKADENESADSAMLV